MKFLGNVATVIVLLAVAGAVLLGLLYYACGNGSNCFP